MIEATSCGGVVIFRGKILLLYKNFKNKYEGWVLPKGTVEEGEDFQDTALREVLEETGSKASIIKYIGKSEYTFHVPEDTVSKEVHWSVMKNRFWKELMKNIWTLKKVICGGIKNTFRRSRKAFAFLFHATYDKLKYIRKRQRRMCRKAKASVVSQNRWGNAYL